MSSRAAVREHRTIVDGIGKGRAYGTLLRRIRTHTAQVAVIGLGNVGLPTAVVVARSGYRVIGVDAREDVVQAITTSKLPGAEPGLQSVLDAVLETGKLVLTTSVPEATRRADIVVVCVQTPVTESREPDLTYLRSACELIAASLSPGKLIVIESTVPPGTTDNIVAKILETRSGLKCGADFWLAHCPERIAPGNGIEEFVKTPRVAGGVDAGSSRAAAEFLKRTTQGDVVTTRSVTAEVAKLAENTFRAVNIAFANELALLCERVGVDASEVIRLTNSHPRVRIHHPGPGVGGPCIPKDQNLLIHAADERGTGLEVTRAARRVNEQMPQHVHGLIVAALNQVGKGNGTPKVCVLGAAYKAGVSSARHSPAERVVKELVEWGAEVVVFDPHCEESFGAARADNLSDAVTGADCVVILTEHDEFRSIDVAVLRNLMNERPVIVDARRILSPAQVTDSGILYVGVGWGHGD